MQKGGASGRAGLGHLVRRAGAELRGTADLTSHLYGLRRRQAMRLPDFLGIGAQKAGSTWLHANLVHHPGIHLPPAKELHYFDWYRVPTLRRYAAEFAPAGERLAGEITPGYSALSARRVRRVQRLLPGIRVLLLLRDPLDRAWSQLCMDLARKQGRNPSEISATEAAARLDQPGARRRSDLAGAVERWSGAYGDLLWIGAYEDIAARPETLLSGVLRHLGVADDLDLSSWPVRERFNPGTNDRPPPAVQAVLVERLGGQREALRRLVPEIVARWEAGS